MAPEMPGIFQRGIVLGLCCLGDTRGGGLLFSFLLAYEGGYQVRLLRERRSEWLRFVRWFVRFIKILSFIKLQSKKLNTR